MPRFNLPALRIVVAFRRSPRRSRRGLCRRLRRQGVDVWHSYGMTTQSLSPVRLTLTKHHHACVSIRGVDAEGIETNLLCDPGSLGPEVSLDGVDAILITHDHPDHVRPSQLAQALEAGIPLWLPADAANRLVLEGELVHVAETGQRLRIGVLDVEVFGDVHARIHPVHSGPLNRGYLVADKVLVTGDEHVDVGKRTVECLVTPMDAPWLRSVDLMDYVAAIRPDVVIGIHDGLLNADGLAIATNILRGLETHGLVREAVRLEVGESRELGAGA